jgi:hypothetical protein
MWRKIDQVAVALLGRAPGGAVELLGERSVSPGKTETAPGIVIHAALGERVDVVLSGRNGVAVDFGR